jgi:hypothetical protein
MSDAASWIVSRRNDLAWFFGGAVASLAALALLPKPRWRLKLRRARNASGTTSINPLGIFEKLRLALQSIPREMK